MKETIIFTVEKNDKNILKEKAKELKISLADYCRMELLGKRKETGGKIIL